ncbi:MAG: chemotaxis protein CheW [Bacteroidales bacterium]|jgi:purine-binding chemotaxis protein CheW|nr:chemotaxis protein CheW [Bacteroidales bacterium]MDD3272457.1 chemotaxis protein CheW [Bacteroidales bacterium]MDD4057613.1 chemotaxis protein CheW [Bacteroidales bacterium]
MNQDNLTVLLIGIANLNFSFPVEMIERVILAQDISPCDNTNSLVIGVINIHSEIIPVISLRKRFSLPEIEIKSDNFLVILSFKNIKIAIIADSVSGIINILRSDIREYTEILPGMSELQFVTHSDGIYYIYNSENLLSTTEEESIRDLQKYDD